MFDNTLIYSLFRYSHISTKLYSPTKNASYWQYGNISDEKHSWQHKQLQNYLFFNRNCGDSYTLLTKKPLPYLSTPSQKYVVNVLPNPQTVSLSQELAILSSFDIPD